MKKVITSLLAFVFADELLESADIYKKAPALILIFQPILYAFAPAIFFSVKYLTTIEKKISSSILLHIIPYVMVLSLYVYAYFQQPDYSSFNQDTNDDFTLQIILLALFFLQISFYLYFSIRLHCNKHR